MKKIFLLLSACLVLIIPFVSNAQINKIEWQGKENINPVLYDSLENFTHQKDKAHYQKYIGQEIYFFPIRSSFKEGINMELCVPDTVWIKKVKKPKHEKHYLLKYNYGWEYNSRQIDVSHMDAFSGKHFIIQNVIYDTTSTMLVLSPADSSKKCFIYHFTNIYHSETPPFVIIGYLEKMKKELVGKKFINNKESNLRTTIINKDIYTIEKIDFDENFEYDLPSVFFSCANGAIFSVPLVKYPRYNPLGMESWKYPGYSLTFKDFTDFEHFTKEQSTYLAELNKKYGSNDAELIRQGIVHLGFTKEMCIDAWGHPEDINRTITYNTTREQWVYSSSRYLYFENGRLTAIQN